MATQVRTTGWPRATGRSVGLAGGVGLSVLLSLAPAVLADEPPLYDVGLFGEDASATELAVSDTGDAEACTEWGCFLIGLAVSGTGNASNWHYGGQAVSGLGDANAGSGNGYAVSGGGNATSGAGTAVAGVGDADAGSSSGSGSAFSVGGNATTPSGTAIALGGDASAGAGLAVSGTGNANGHTAIAGLGDATSGNGSAVTTMGTARSRGCSSDPVQDAASGYAVSVTGNAYGCHSVSVTGEAGPAS